MFGFGCIFDVGFCPLSLTDIVHSVHSRLAQPCLLLRLQDTDIAHVPSPSSRRSRSNGLATGYAVVSGGMVHGDGGGGGEYYRGKVWWRWRRLQRPAEQEGGAQYLRRKINGCCGGWPRSSYFLAVNDVHASVKTATTRVFLLLFRALCLGIFIFSFFSFQKKIDEAEAKRQEYEQQRDALKTKTHSLNSIDMKVGGRGRRWVIPVVHFSPQNSRSSMEESPPTIELLAAGVSRSLFLSSIQAEEGESSTCPSADWSISCVVHGSTSYFKQRSLTVHSLSARRPAAMQSKVNLWLRSRLD